MKERDIPSIDERIRVGYNTTPIDARDRWGDLASFLGGTTFEPPHGEQAK